MDRLAYERNVDEIHPWQEFDMIGGTSTVSTVVSLAPRIGFNTARAVF
jgi:hypothetical protein